jgi:hypothetical protein
VKLTVYIRIGEKKSSVQIIQQFGLHIVPVYQTNRIQNQLSGVSVLISPVPQIIPFYARKVGDSGRDDVVPTFSSGHISRLSLRGLINMYLELRLGDIDQIGCTRWKEKSAVK